MSPDAIRTVTATSSEEISCLREDWRRVRQAMGVLTPNADPDWFAIATMAIEGAEGHVSVVYRGREPVGLVLGRRVRKRYRHKIGYLRLPAITLRCMDVVYGGLLACAEDGETQQEVIRVLEGFLDSSDCDCLFVNHLPSLWPLTERIREVAVRRKSGAFVRRELHWCFDLEPGSFEATMGRFSKKHARNLRRQDRVMREYFGGDLAVRVFTRAEEVDELARGTAAISGTTYQAALGTAFSDDQLWRSRLRLEAERGALRSYWLVGGGEPVAFMIGEIVGDVYVPEAMGYLAAHRQMSPGTVLLIRVFEDLCGLRMRSVDYGFGDAAYKQTYGTRSWEEDTFWIYASTHRAQVRRWFHRLVVFANMGLHVIARDQTRSRVKARWRRLLGGQAQ